MKKTPKPENVTMNVTTMKKIGEKLQKKKGQGSQLG